LIGNFAEVIDGLYENLTSNTLRQKSIYWGTADRVTTVISDALLGYAVPTAGSSLHYVQDWDYQNLLPKSYLGTTSNPNPKFFLDLFTWDATASSRIVLIGSNAWYWGSHSGRFEKAFILRQDVELILIMV